MVSASTSNLGPLSHDSCYVRHIAEETAASSTQLDAPLLDEIIEGINQKEVSTIEEISCLSEELKNLHSSFELLEETAENGQSQTDLLRRFGLPHSIGQDETELCHQSEKMLEIQQLVYEIIKTYSASVEKKLSETMKEVDALQKKMGTLHRLLEKINDLTDEKTGQLEINDEELKKLIQESKALGLDFNGQEGKALTKYERDNLVEKVKNLTKDLNTEFSLLSKKADRLNNERTELLKYAQMIMKTLHEIFMKMARLMKGS